MIAMGNDTRTDEDKFLMGGDKVKSASFLRKGDSVEGVILETKIRQQTDAKSRKPKFFDDGSPMNALVVVLQTNEFDEEWEDGEDDGRRQVWVKFKMRDAVSAACKEAGVSGLRPGGKLSLTLVKQDKPKSVGLSGVKHYEATYEPPDEDADADAYLSGDDDGADEPEETAPPAKKAAAKKAAPPKPSAAPAHHGPWVEDDYHYEDEDGNRFFAVDGEWVEYIAPPAPAKKAPAKKAAPKPPADEDSF